MNALPRREMPNSHGAFATIVGATALVAPALHVLTDLMEWHHQGFTAIQLWLNLLAFLPMPVLLLGLFAVQAPRPRAYGLVGALLYGAAFAYFTFTTIYALVEHVPDYASLWERLGHAYTFCGGLMVGGGVLFAWSALDAGWFPRLPVWLFLGGLLVNLMLALLPAPDILQTLGSAIRNFGLMGMGYAILTHRTGTAP